MLLIPTKLKGSLFKGRHTIFVVNVGGVDSYVYLPCHQYP